MKEQRMKILETCIEICILGVTISLVILVFKAAHAANSVDQVKANILTKVWLPSEYCYKGVSYVQSGSGHGTWGSIMLDRNGKPIACESR
jgi:hypothetical protein